MYMVEMTVLLADGGGAVTPKVAKVTFSNRICAVEGS